MENFNDSDEIVITDVRYKRAYSVIVIVASVLLIITAIIMKVSFIIDVLICDLMFHGIVTLFGRKYLRHDKQNRILKADQNFYLFFHVKYKYDRIYFMDEGSYKSLWVEKDGKKTFIRLKKILCNNDDYAEFSKEIEVLKI